MIKYDKTFRIRALDMYFRVKLYKPVMDAFGICRKTLYNWIHNKSTNKNYPTYLFRNNKLYNPTVINYILDNSINNNKFKTTDLVLYLNEHFKPYTYNKNNIYYVLHKNNITYKRAHKKVIIDKTKYIDSVKKIKDTIKIINEDNIISIDESHFCLNMCSNYGYNYKGKPVTFVQQSFRRDMYSLILAVSNKTIIHSTIKKGSITSIDYLIFIKDLIGKLNDTSKTLLMDNASIHRSAIIKEYINSTIHKILYNVPYNPETNPIEQVFHKIKLIVKKELTSSIEDIKIAINKAINNITIDNLKSYFKKSFTDN